jgi:hypothetical protein
MVNVILTNGSADGYYVMLQQWKGYVASNIIRYFPKELNELFHLWLVQNYVCSL